MKRGKKVQEQKDGKQLRQKITRKEQRAFNLTKNRPAIVSFMKDSNQDRLQNLVPIRHARMSVSPFAFNGARLALWLTILLRCRIPV